MVSQARKKVRVILGNGLYFLNGHFYFKKLTEFTILPTFFSASTGLSAYSWAHVQPGMNDSLGIFLIYPEQAQLYAYAHPSRLPEILGIFARPQALSITAS